MGEKDVNRSNEMQKRFDLMVALIRDKILTIVVNP
jgi:hypothetical protein